ncbi:hypothetical protein [Ralstonia pickettii]|uniref:COG4315 family predicted lipoprotein n=1 Tax=Ralstonia pickettii TaxID=329 RepID=UPI0004692F8E|nr:hypothetical protein [Ralstonia pickettii]
MLRTSMILALGAMLSLPALADPPKILDGRLVDQHNMTLYVFDQDTTVGKSMCNGACATNWAPALADAYDKASGNWSFVMRDDGQRQWAYKGHPLYHWVIDKKPGDATGDGIKGVWHVAKP